MEIFNFSIATSNSQALDILMNMKNSVLARKKSRQETPYLFSRKTNKKVWNKDWKMKNYENGNL